MGPNRTVRRWLSTAVLLLGVLCTVPQLQAAGNGDGPAVSPQAGLRRQAERCEQTGAWDRASDLWEQLLGKDPGRADLREHYQRCLRRAQQVRRLRDASYRDQANKLSLPEALQVYGEVLAKLHLAYVERGKVEFPLLFKHGLEEFRLALDEAVFRQVYLAGVKPEAIRAFQAQLGDVWGGREIRQLADAQAQARELALAAQKTLGLRPTLVLLELACGACGALDEYTYYLTPGQFEALDASWKGECVGVGIEVAIEDQKLVVSHVVPGSSADQRGIREHDCIRRIGNRPVEKLSAEAAAELLRGKRGTTLNLEVASAGETPRVVKELKREVLHVPSVPEPRFLDGGLGIGYIQLLNFQETTVQELDLAILKLQADGLRVLILDLRGNRGGLFEVALQVAERFVSTGVLVFTQGQAPEHNRVYQAQGLNLVTVPLVVLIDGETASSAELVAGALKENQRGKLVGETTFGKGSIQRVRRLDSAASAIRMTVAKFFSPRGNPYSGSGVAPNIAAARTEGPADSDQDAQLEAALEVARPLALGH